MTANDAQEDFATIHVAIGVVSAVCDYARENDGQGFNAADAWLGHTLAEMPAGAWTGDTALAAWDMLRKYRGQLAVAGIEYDQLPRPDGADELEAEWREQARERARERARQWRDQQYRKSRSYVRCDGDGEEVVLSFVYDPDLVAACRKIEGRAYDGATKANRYPFTSLPDVIKFAEDHNIDVTPDVRALAAIAADRAAERAALPQVRLDDNGTIIIDASLDPDVYQALKETNNDRSTWDPKCRVHRLPLYLAAGLLTLADGAGLTVSDEARAAIQEHSAQQDRNRAEASAFEAASLPVPGLAAELALKPQQYPVVRFALEHRRVLIGDDMGWGKTLSSLAAVAADGAYPAVVVCRPSLTLNWSAEIRRFFPGLKIYEASGTTPRPVPPGADVIVIGSAALAAKPRKTETGGKEFGWVTELAKTGPRALIIDEGQDTKERTANRSQACEQLAARVIERNGLVLDLTGTAILNRPRELCQQLTILGRLHEFGGEKKFLWRYCLSEMNRYGADYNGARNLIELHDRLRAWGIMIRRSDDGALGLPPCREHVLVVPQADLNPDVMTRYREAESNLLEFLADQARQAAERLGKDPNSAAVEAAMRAATAEHLVAINTLRQLAGQAKREYVTRWIRRHVDVGEKVMVAAHHRPEVDAYAAEFGGLKLQGGQSVIEKEKAKAAFQHQPAADTPVISVAIGAGGVGHTLTAARIGVQAEQAWTPGETQQMKKRMHRIGQDRPVDYYVTVAEGTIDEQLWDVVTAKQATLDAVLDGRSETGTDDSETSVAADLTWRLTQQGLGNPAPARPDSGDTAEDSVSATVPTTAVAAEPTGTGRGQVPGQRAKVVPEAVLSDSAEAPQGDSAEAAPEPAAQPVHETGQARAADVCAVCGTAMTIIEPGQTAHPMCEAGPVATTAAATGNPRREEPNETADSDTALAVEEPAASNEPGTGRRASHAQDDDEDDTAHAEAWVSPQRLRQSAHRYLDEGLLPVPAWAARQNGECCCPRGADCDRPGKHPRSVRTSPGPGGYSWKPLVCRTPADVDVRFADDSEYATGNLMVAIPEGMMAIDRDDDDGGRAAVEALAEELGSLPPTLSHGTPHGEHLVYRTPDGWKGRAWVGKAPGNPVPPGVDLRMPGQILMAAPSVVPGREGSARYGPVTGNHIAPLPAAYVTAWTPPQPTRAAVPATPRPIPAASTDRAAKYVSDAMSRITEDLATRGPGGRNAAVYAAGLKAGSLLGAARGTPGAEHAAWTDEQAEQALLDAAQRNGYTSKDGEAEALRAIRSGLRNGLRAPRALPDFTAHRAAPDRPSRPQATARPAWRPSADQARGRPAAAPRRSGRRWQDMVPEAVRREVEAADKAAAARRRAAIAAHQQAIEQYDRVATAATAAEIERTRAEAHAAHQEYTTDGRHVTGRHDAAMLRWAASITAQREQPAAESAAEPADDTREHADAAAAAANQAYQAGNLGQAQEHTDQAAEIDPSRADLWQQYRDQITARRAVLAARQAYRETGDRRRAEQLLEQARQIDPPTRGRALWDTGLPTPPARRPQRQAGQHGPARQRQRQTAGQQAMPQRQQATARTWPSPPARRDPLPSAADPPRPPERHAASPREPRTSSEATPGEPATSHRAPAADASADQVDTHGNRSPVTQNSIAGVVAEPDPTDRSQPATTEERQPQMAWHPANETPSPDEPANTDALYERPADPAHEARLDQLAEAEAWAERADQESRGIPWADGPDRTYEQMEKDDADFAAKQARRGRGEAEAEAEAEPDI